MQNRLVESLVDGTQHLRVLITDERKYRLAQIAPIVVALGHEPAVVVAGHRVLP